MASYDPQIIVRMADRLYDAALNIVAAYTFVGAVLGLAGGFAVGLWMHSNVISLYAAGIAGFITGAIGFLNGQKAALTMRFQAQQALVMVEIERNTRGVR